MSSLGTRVASIAALVAALLVPCAVRAVDLQSYDLVERGRYLATAADCAACHTKPGGAPFAGGVALETPFGTLVGPNITPDPDAGIGVWSDDEFVSALQEGRGRGGIRLYPAMPYPAYTKMTREDALAIRAYLRTGRARARQDQREPTAFPVQHPLRHGGVECAELQAGAA
jgi:Cytochrome c